MKALIVDDEPMARGVLRTFLQQDPEITLVDECENGSHAVGKIATSDYDFLFLDVQMPDMDGFRVLHESNPSRLPLVIFVTAHEEHAMRAFSFDAIDYLLKPFDDRRFAKTLKRAKQRLRERQLAVRSRELVDLLSQAMDPGNKAQETLVVQSGSRTVRLAASQIRWIEAQDKHVVIHTDAETIRARSSISSVEQMLAPHAFLRVHRSCLVALSRIKFLDKTEGGVPFVVMDDDSRVTVSRSRLAAIRSRLQDHS